MRYDTPYMCRNKQISRYTLYALILSGLLMTTGCRSEEQIRIQQTAKAVRALTDARTRVVWAEDVGDNRDVFARDVQLRLMGYDSDDGKGARIIRRETANYSKPLITPRGDRVVYTDFDRELVYRIDFDGTHHRKLTRGTALDVWLDVRTGVEWVYVGRDRVDARGDPYRMVYRVRLDDPDIEELVWDRRVVGTDNFQLSANGKRASGVFPWPNAGVADLSDGSWERLGNGCWPSLAPDNSYLFWIFDGSHRNIAMFDTQNDRRWEMRINTAPGIDGYEVYHPRWSNHPRFMTMTGPYKHRVGGNNIRGGGPDVEVHIGRFNEDFTEIEAWTRVTESDRAAFFPDVWVESGLTLLTERTDEEPVVKREKPADTWPVVQDNLVFIWEDRSRNNEINDQRSGEIIMCQVEPEGKARYGRFFDMDVRHDRFVAENAEERLVEQFRGSPEFAFEALITPSGTPSDTPGLIAGMSEGPDRRNFGLVQQGDTLYFELRLSPNDGSSELEGRASARPGTRGSASLQEEGEDHATPIQQWELFPLEANEPNHIIVSYRPGKLSAWRNGVQQVDQEVEHGDFRNWEVVPLLFGNDLDDHADWPGWIEGVALYNRTLHPEEAAMKYTRYVERLARREHPESAVVEARLVRVTEIPTPESIEPYRRALTMNEYEVLEVKEGNMEGDRILVAHWVIMDDRILDTAERAPGQIYRMTLEFFDDRPELEGEWLAMESDDFLLPTYFDIDS